MQKYRVTRHEVIQPQDQSIKLIPLTKGHNAIVDAADYDWLMQWNWCTLKHERGFYAVRRGTDGEFIYMHRVLINHQAIDTDHHNGNGLDNRRHNLRPCSHSQNGSNRGKQRDNTTGYKGVYHFKKIYWQSKIAVESKQIHLGYFKTAEEAARAYDAAALKYFGEFAHLNFPLS